MALFTTPQAGAISRSAIWSESMSPAAAAISLLLTAAWRTMPTPSASAGRQTRCYIAGIRDITTAIDDAIPVVVDSASQLGTVSSSKRFKKEIKPIEATISRLAKQVDALTASLRK
jgi:hypothetical protein